MVADHSDPLTIDTSSPRYQRGLELRRHTLGAEYVDAALETPDEFQRFIQEYVTDYVWGTIWGRDGLEPRIRSLVTLAMLAGLNNPGELRTHIRGAIRNGCTPDEVRETLLHAAVYFGVPAALSALAIARTELSGAPG